MRVAALVILWFSDIEGSKSEHYQRFCSLESQKDLDTRYNKMLQKSMTFLTLPFSPAYRQAGKGKGRGEGKERRLNFGESSIGN
jgi:hypothetical protein